MSRWGKASFVVLLAAIIVAASHTPGLAGYNEGLRHFDKKDYGAAFKEWKQAVDQGDAGSQYRLAKPYEDGLSSCDDKIGMGGKFGSLVCLR